MPYPMCLNTVGQMSAQSGRPAHIVTQNKDKTETKFQLSGVQGTTYVTCSTRNQTIQIQGQ